MEKVNVVKCAEVVKVKRGNKKRESENAKY